MIRFLLLICFTAFVSLGLSSHNPDSLRLLLQSKQIADTTRVNVLNELADMFEEKAADSCVFYGKRALDLATSVHYLKGCGKA